MKKDETNEQYKARLEKLAREKTEASRKAAEENAQRQLAAMGEYADLSDGGPFAHEFGSLFKCLVQDGFSYWFTSRDTANIRDALIQYLLFRQSLVYDKWYVVKSPDATRSDEKNLGTYPSPLYGFMYDERFARDTDIEDILVMLGKLARNIKSPSLLRITQLMVDLDQSHVISSQEEAAQLVDDFIACLLRVKKETLLLEDDEAAKVWPTLPVHEIEEDHLDTGGMDEYEATEASREAALEVYHKNMKDLMRPEGERLRIFHPMSPLADYIKKMADDAEKGKPKADNYWHKLDTAKLARVLGANTELSYDIYEQTDDGLAVVANTSDDTEENDLKNQIVADLDRYLSAAIALAQSAAPRAYADLALCQSLETKYRGNFFPHRGRSKTAIAADLKIFIDALERARPVLWADCANYKPPKTTTPEPTKIDKGDSKIGKACSSFVTYFSKKEHVVKMRVKAASGPVDAPFKIISDDKLWSVISQLVSADVFPITLDNPWAPNKLNLKARFRPTKNHEDARHQFYKYIHCVGKGSKAMYELKVV